MRGKSDTLHLVLKGKWYDMIASGEKKEEYREIKPYWTKRFNAFKSQWLLSNSFIWHIGKLYLYVCFHRGYTSETMTFECEPIDVRKGNPKWGAPINKDVFVIKLGKRIK